MPGVLKLAVHGGDSGSDSEKVSSGRDRIRSHSPPTTAVGSQDHILASEFVPAVPQVSTYSPESNRFVFVEETQLTFRFCHIVEPG